MGGRPPAPADSGHQRSPGLLSGTPSRWGTPAAVPGGHRRPVPSPRDTCTPALPGAGACGVAGTGLACEPPAEPPARISGVLEMGGGNPDWAARWAASNAQPPSDGACRLSTAWVVRRSAGMEPPPRPEPAGPGIASGVGESSTCSPIGDSASNSYMEVPPNLISRLTPSGWRGIPPRGYVPLEGPRRPPR